MTFWTQRANVRVQGRIRSLVRCLTTRRRTGKDDQKESTWLIAILSLGTLFAVATFAWVSKRKTEERLDDNDAPKSTLASDAPDHP